MSGAKDLGKALAKVTSDQATTRENISPDEPESLLNLNAFEVLELKEDFTATQKTYPDNSFIIDHPVYGDIDNPDLFIDGDYRWGNLHEDLAAYYSCNGTLDDDHASFDGTDSNVSFSTYLGRKYALFNGTTATCSLPAGNTIITNNSAWSITCWFLRQSSASGQRIINFATSSAGQSSIRLYYSSTGIIAFGYRDSGGTLRDAYTFSDSAGWHHLGFTYDGTTYRSYLDGTLVDETVDTFSGVGSAAPGIGSFNGGNLLNGALSGIGVWNRVLSDGEMAGLYSEVPASTTYPINNVLETVLYTVSS